MSLWSRIFGPSRKKDGQVATSNDPAGWFLDWLGGGGKSHAGVNVNHMTALRDAAVWACVRVRSEDVGKVACDLYKKSPDGSKQLALNHPLYSLVRDAPNPRMGAFEFRQLLQAWVDLRGNGYALKEYGANGRVAALWPIDPTWVQVLHILGDLTSELWYRLTVPGKEIITLPADAVFHVRGLTIDGRIGLSAISYHRETIGLGIAAREYGAAFFGNSAKPEGIITLPGVVSPAAKAVLRADWERRHKGPGNARSLGLLDGGMTWQQTTVDNTDAQYLETRQFQNTEIYRLFRVPPHIVGDLSQATNNNIEQQSIEYVRYCLSSEFKRWSDALKRELLLDAEKATYDFCFDEDSLLRGDMLSRYQAIAAGRSWGVLSANEARASLGMNPIPNGDFYLQPLNMVQAGTKAPAPASPAPGQSTEPGQPPKPNGANGNAEANP